MMTTEIDKCCKIYFYNFSCMYNCQCLVRLLEVHIGDMVSISLDEIFLFNFEKIHGNPAYADVRRE